MRSMIDVHTLPDDPAVLKNTLCEVLQALHKSELAFQALEEKFKLAQAKLFGQSAEKWSPDARQFSLVFNEAEMRATQPVADEEETEEIHYTRRKKRGRKSIPDYLPKTIIEHEGTEEETTCTHCHASRPVIGHEETKEVDIIPAQVQVLVHRQKKYGPCDCEEFVRAENKEIVVAKKPPRLLPGSMASAGTLAYAMTAKFVDGLPFYRFETICMRLGIEISRATMCNWAMQIAVECDPILQLMWKDVIAGPFVQMDETPVQVLKEPQRPATRKSYMWVTIGYQNGDTPVIMYHYHPTRGADVPQTILAGFSGHLQTDAYQSYEAVAAAEGIPWVKCWAHARRMFTNAVKVSKKAPTAQIALGHIRKIYKIEKQLRTQLNTQRISKDEFVIQRKEQTFPILKTFHEWIADTALKTLPAGKTGEALAYTANHWKELIRYLDAWYITPDNNRCENAIRPFVIGRKNWLFSDTPRGAHASAAIYSLVETAKKNDYEPYAYLKHLFEHLPKADTEEQLRALLPYADLPLPRAREPNVKN